MGSIDITRLDEDPHETVYGIREDTSSRGVDLEGAQITATYADGTVETLTWEALDPYTFGGATGTDIEMSFGFDWHELTTTRPLASLRIDLQPASSVFDTTLATDDDPAGGSTPSSLNGFPFTLAPEYDPMPGNLGVTYSGIVNVAGSPAVGDLYTTMLVDFSGLPAGGLLGDLRWNSDIDTMLEDGDLEPAGMRCFARGTLIATDCGDVPVEILKAGCRVLTQDNGYQVLSQIMHRAVGAQELAKNPRLLPVRIRAGALGSGLPNRDLIVSRQHRMIAKSCIVERMFEASTALVAAIRLTELPGIRVEDAVEGVEYFHLVFERHEIIFAEGAPTESFLVNSETRKEIGHASWREFVTLFPDVEGPEASEAPARIVPSRLLQKELVHRHMKNAKELVSM